MQKVISFFEEAIGIGADVDVTDPNNVGLTLWYEQEDEEDAARVILIENSEYFEKTFLAKLYDNWEKSEHPDLDMAPFLQQALLELSDYDFDVDDTFVDDFWHLICEISMCMLLKEENAPEPRPASIVAAYCRRKGIDLPEKESSTFSPEQPPRVPPVFALKNSKHMNQFIQTMEAVKSRKSFPVN